MRLAALRHSEQFPQVVHQGLKHPRREPPAGLLIDGMPRGQVVGQQPPPRARADDPTEAVENLPQVVVALRGIQAHEREVGGNQCPFFGADITRIRFADRHALMLFIHRRKVHNTL